MHVQYFTTLVLQDEAKWRDLASTQKPLRKKHGVKSHYRLAMLSSWEGLPK